MNQYTTNLNRIEFVITYACTGHCKHCSEGSHSGFNEYIDAETAVRSVHDIAQNYNITSLMTFGGEPLIYPEVVCAIHSEAKRMKIQKRQLITNGFFSNDIVRIKNVVKNLAQSGVNEILLSVDAFHQENIPLEPVLEFASEMNNFDVDLKLNPAWLVSKEHDNTYNCRTRQILEEFEAMGIPQADGNIIFPSGNALKYLSEYFDMGKEYVNPYDDDPLNIRAVCINPNGDVLGGNIYKTHIMQILESYEPQGEEVHG